MTVLRIKDSYQKRIYDYINDIYIVCPSCTGKAIVKGPDRGPFGSNQDQEIRMVCPNCGYSKKLTGKPTAIISSVPKNKGEGGYFIIGDTVDPYFHQQLWLTLNCCDNILWAYNYDHLNFLKQHVEAKLRERTLEDISNKSLGSRLPKWMTSKKNRDVVVNAIEQLQRK